MGDETNALQYCLLRVECHSIKSSNLYQILESQSNRRISIKSSNLYQIVESLSNRLLFNGTWQKRRRELEKWLRLEFGEMTLQMHQAVFDLYTCAVFDLYTCDMTRLRACLTCVIRMWDMTYSSYVGHEFLIYGTWPHMSHTHAFDDVTHVKHARRRVMSHVYKSHTAHVYKSNRDDVITSSNAYMWHYPSRSFTYVILCGTWHIHHM